jgi:RND superfamily putative drug exporter
MVTGATANDIDATEFILDHTPAAGRLRRAATVIILFLLLGSVLLPLKAVVMNLLSIAASFGALVWIFQEGKFLGAARLRARPDRTDAAGASLLRASSPVDGLRGAAADAHPGGVRRTGDNTHAVADGLERSGRLITSAAAIMVAVFAAFALADIVLVKAMGSGWRGGGARCDAGARPSSGDHAPLRRSQLVGPRWLRR